MSAVECTLGLDLWGEGAYKSDTLQVVARVVFSLTRKGLSENEALIRAEYWRAFCKAYGITANWVGLSKNIPAPFGTSALIKRSPTLLGETKHQWGFGYSNADVHLCPKKMDDVDCLLDNIENVVKVVPVFSEAADEENFLASHSTLVAIVHILTDDRTIHVDFPGFYVSKNGTIYVARLDRLCGFEADSDMLIRISNHPNNDVPVGRRMPDIDVYCGDNAIVPVGMVKLKGAISAIRKKCPEFRTGVLH